MSDLGSFTLRQTYPRMGAFLDTDMIPTPPVLLTYLPQCCTLFVEQEIYNRIYVNTICAL